MRAITEITVKKETYKGKTHFEVWCQYNNKRDDWGFDIYETESEMEEAIVKIFMQEDSYFPVYVSGYTYREVEDLKQTTEKFLQIV